MFASLIRPETSVLPLLVYTSYLIFTGTFTVIALLLGWIVLLSSYGIVVIHNDIVDKDIDKANKRSDTPLAANLLTLKDARRALALSIITALLSSYLLNPLLVLWVFTYIFFGWLYSGPALLKNRGYSALTVLAINYGVMPWLLGVISAEGITTTSLPITLIASFIFVFGIISLKDFKDYKGDNRYGKNTVLVKYGPQFTHYLIYVTTSLAYTLLVIGAFVNGHVILGILGIVAGSINYTLLSSKSVLSIPSSRANRGNTARLLFFLYAVVICFN